MVVVLVVHEKKGVEDMKNIYIKLRDFFEIPKEKTLEKSRVFVYLSYPSNS